MSLHNSSELILRETRNGFSTIELVSIERYMQRSNRLRRFDRSSEKERKGNALASGADEGRDKLRKASGSCK